MTLATTVAAQLPVDAAWFRQVNALARTTTWLQEPMRLYAEYGVALFGVLLLAGWWVARGSGDVARIAAAVWAPVGTLIAVGLNQPVVHAVHEARPYSVLPHVMVLVSRSSDYSFPSDHAVMAGAVTAGVFLVSRRLGLVALLAALVMAFARVFVGAHYPHDVAAGLVLGAVVALAGFFLLRRVLVWLVTTLARTPVRPLLTVTQEGAL